MGPREPGSSTIRDERPFSSRPESDTLGGVTSTPPSAPATILIADDDRVTREYVGGLLRGSGYQIEIHEDGKTLLDRVGKGGVDLVLLDVMMPGLSGIDVCRLVKAMVGEDFLPIMLVTAKGDPDSRVEGLRIGADDYISKPFDERELLARVQNMLRLKRMHDEVNDARARLERLAVRDELTGLYNYRYLHTRLQEEFKRAERFRDPLACAMIDLDHFKAFNERFGHSLGDLALQETAKRLRGSVREIDVVARYGGEEFLLVLPSTHFGGALTVADRVWRTIGATPYRLAGKEYRITVSVGVALYPSRDVKTKDELVKAADRALFQAKDDGRDRICVFQHQGYIYRPDSTPSSSQG